MSTLAPAGSVEPEPSSCELASIRQLGLFWGLFSLSVMLLAPFADAVVGVLPGCHFERILGWPCPTCGTKSAAYHLAELEPLAALRASPFATAVWVVLLGGGVVAGGAVLVDRSGRVSSSIASLAGRLTPSRQRRAAFALLAIGALNWLYLVVAAGVV